MKKRPEVVKAEAAVEAAKQRVAEAQAALQRAAEDRHAAAAALHRAYHAADEELPRCTMVCKGQRGWSDSASSAVILRRTPAGRLAVRAFGAPHLKPDYFTRTGRGWEYIDRGGRSFSSTIYILRDVPAEFDGERCD